MNVLISLAMVIVALVFALYFSLVIFRLLWHAFDFKRTKAEKTEVKP